MGYTTRYRGTVEFGSELTITDLQRLNALLALGPNDPNGPPEWIGLKINESFTGLEDSGDEKIYGMHKTLNWLTTRMKEHRPDFILKGGFVCAGEDGEVWRLVLEDGVAKEVAIEDYVDVKNATDGQKFETLWKAIDEQEREIRKACNYDPEEYYSRMKGVFDKIREVLKR